MNKQNIVNLTKDFDARSLRCMTLGQYVAGLFARGETFELDKIRALRGQDFVDSIIQDVIEGRIEVPSLPPDPRIPDNPLSDEESQSFLKRMGA